MQIQAGQFVPIMGNFLNRQDNWDAGLISFPALYLQDVAEPDLPAGRAIGDYMQRNLGFGLTWKKRHWQVWASHWS